MWGLARFVLIPWGVCTCLLFVIHEKKQPKKAQLSNWGRQSKGHKIKHPLLSGKKQKTSFIERGSNINHHYPLVIPYLKGLISFGGNVAGLTVLQKFPPAGIPSPASLPGLKKSTPRTCPTRKNRISHFGAAERIPLHVVAPGAGFKQTAGVIYKFLGPLVTSEKMKLYIQSLIITYIYYGLEFYK